MDISTINSHLAFIACSQRYSCSLINKKKYIAQYLNEIFSFIANQQIVNFSSYRMLTIFVTEKKNRFFTSLFFQCCHIVTIYLNHCLASRKKIYLCIFFFSFFLCKAKVLSVIAVFKKFIMCQMNSLSLGYTEMRSYKIYEDIKMNLYLI